MLACFNIFDEGWENQVSAACVHGSAKNALCVCVCVCVCVCACLCASVFVSVSVSVCLCLVVCGGERN